MKKLFVLPLLLLSCFNPQGVDNQAEIIKSVANTVALKHPNVNHIKPQDLRKLKADEFLLVDVRTGREQEVSKIKGAITAAEFELLLESQKESLNQKQIVFYCTIGARSSAYAATLLKSGYEGRVSNLHGSILAWVQAGLPLVDKDEKVTKKVHVYSEAWSFVPKGYEAVWR